MQNSLQNPAHLADDSTCKNDSLPYYLMLKDNAGNGVSFNFSGNYSSSPYEGFKIDLPPKFKNIIQNLLVQGTENLYQYKEFTAFSDDNYNDCSFLITVNKLILGGKEFYQYLIRSTEGLNPILEDCNKQLLHERKLNKINFKCISSVSHDFRTPLSIIYANLQLLEHHELKLDRETIEDSFSLSRMAVKSLLRVLDKVTVIDSINKGKLEFKPGLINLESTCNNLVKELNEAEVIPDRIKYLHDKRINEIELDEYLFKSLFTHLIHNALSYSKKSQNVIFKSDLIDKKTIRFTVQDFGVGLFAEQKQLLSVYFSDSMDAHPEGIGLGLAIVKECIHLLRGKISISSEAGKGSVFVIDIPINQ